MASRIDKLIKIKKDLQQVFKDIKEVKDGKSSPALQNAMTRTSEAKLWIVRKIEYLSR